jgi:hypothetical protein
MGIRRSLNRADLVYRDRPADRRDGIPGGPRRLYEAVASALGMTPVATFKAELRQQFLNGLKNAGQNACATQLQATFDQNP